MSQNYNLADFIHAYKKRVRDDNAREDLLNLGYNLDYKFFIRTMLVRWIVILFCSVVVMCARTHSVCEVERTDGVKAKEIIQKILQDEPSNVICMLQLANVYLKQGDIAQGFETLVSAYSIDPHYVQKTQIAAVLPFALKVTSLKFQAAQTNDKSLWIQLGDGYFEMAIYQEAILMYKKALLVDPKEHMIRLKMALAYEKSTHVYSALEEIRVVLDFEPKHLYANYYMGKFLAHNLKNKELAEAYFRQAKESLLKQKDQYGYLEFTNLLSDITRELGE